MSNANVFHFTDDNFNQEVMQHNQLVLVDFWASWCAPCRAIAPHIESLAQSFAGKVKVGKMNVDEEANTPTNLGIRALPTILLFKNGQVVEQIVGAVSKDKLENAITSNL